MSRPIGQVDAGKAAVYAIVINALQILAMLAILVWVILDGGTDTLGNLQGEVLLAVLALIVIWGAAADIREAVAAGKISHRFGALNETVEQITDLNTALRSQRHDFLNHLQVVYSLMEMEEYDEARGYINQVYGDIQALGKSLRTQNVPVNALLRAKMGDAERQKASFILEAKCAWKNLPVEDWQMCRVLGNLIDNALDAMKGQKDACVRVILTEDLTRFAFTVENNGPLIPEKQVPHLFDAGFSSKGEGHGMGLYISRKILKDAGGDLTVSSENGRTAFSGMLPKKEKEPEKETE